MNCMPGRAGVSGMAPDTLYEIRVLGPLTGADYWSEGLQVSNDGSQTVICGPEADQAALPAGTACDGRPGGDATGAALKPATTSGKPGGHEDDEVRLEC